MEEACEDDHYEAVDFIKISEARITVEQHMKKIEVDKKK